MLRLWLMGLKICGFGVYPFYALFWFLLNVEPSIVMKRFKKCYMELDIGDNRSSEQIDSTACDIVQV